MGGETGIHLAGEGRTGYRLTARLNELNIAPPYGEVWAPKMIGEIVRRRAYSGKAEYNANQRVPNPSRPLGDPTLGIKRTWSGPSQRARR